LRIPLNLTVIWDNDVRGCRFESGRWSYSLIIYKYIYIYIHTQSMYLFIQKISNLFVWALVTPWKSNVSFSTCFVVNANKFSLHRQVYVYYVYTALSKSPKQLPKCPEKNRNKHSSNHFQGWPLSHPCYTVTISYYLLYMNQVTVVVYLLDSKCNDCRINIVYWYITWIRYQVTVVLYLLYSRCNDCRINIVYWYTSCRFINYNANGLFYI
jgi:hypothetical protein